MRIRSWLVGAGFALVSSTALAFHCPAEMKKIDEALAKNPKLTPAQLAEVKKYRAEGEALHAAGKHQESVDTLQGGGHSRHQVVRFQIHAWMRIQTTS